MTMTMMTMMTMMMTMIMTTLSIPPMQALSAAIPGSPGEDYPIYASPPDTSFACDGKVTGALISLLQHCSLLLAPCSYLLLTPYSLLLFIAPCSSCPLLESYILVFFGILLFFFPPLSPCSSIFLAFCSFLLAPRFFLLASCFFTFAPFSLAPFSLLLSSFFAQLRKMSNNLYHIWTNERKTGKSGMFYSVFYACLCATFSINKFWVRKRITS